MRNIDKIKDLEHELGRYRKKINDQSIQMADLEAKVRLFEEGARQTNVLVDALMAAVAQKYGIVVRGEDDEAIGYRLELDDFAVDRMMDRFEVSSQKRGTQYIIGAMLKEVKEDDTGHETEAGV